MCGGKDRFRVQPCRPDGAKWYCRGCGEGHWHDAIDYVARRDGLDFQEALSSLARNYPVSRKQATPILQDNQDSIQSAINRDTWLDTAHRFVNLCADNLWESSSAKALEYLRWRGLLDTTLIGWQIGYNPEDAYGDPVAWGMTENDSIYLPRGIVIPCLSETSLHYVKIRKGTGTPKYHILKGGQPFLYGAQTYRHNLVAYLFESELDTLLAWQTGFRLGYGSIPAGQKLHVEYALYFTEVEDLIVAFDNDKAGNTAADKLCRISPKFHKAGPIPVGKDLTEYYQSTGNLEDVLIWLYDQLDCIKEYHGS